MPLAEITIVKGRSPDQKRALLTEVTDAIHRALDAPKENIRVAIREIPTEHWAIAGISLAERAQK